LSRAILLTGATGFLGMETLARLLERDEEAIFVLVRAEDERGARERLAGVLCHLYAEHNPAAERVRVVRGDLLQPGLGLSAGDRRLLIDSVDRIIHCAASISFQLSLEQAREINVEGLARVLELARDIAEHGQLTRMVHVSTAYVSGRHVGCFREQDLDLGQAFRNTYERSKHEGEDLLRVAGDLPVVIARPSIVVGHRASGWTPAFNVIYWPIRAFERGLFDELPARADSIVDFVPVDYVADGLLALLDDPLASGTYHLVAGRRALSAGELVDLHSSLLGSRKPARFVEQDGVAGLPQGAEAYLPYFDVRCSFDDSRARAVVGAAGVVPPEPGDFFERLIAYARRTAWGKRPLSRQAAMSAAGVS
jgi:thioester reductase-like protein